MNNVLAMVLAGGVGSRLMPLTRDRAKPAVPFAGRYRIIDFVLSNLVNSGIYKIKVITQYKSQSLNTHLSRAWQLSPILGQYVEPVPAQQRLGPHWYLGSADAVYQNINVITDEEPDYVAVFGGDHIYKMDVRQMLDWHRKKSSDLTVAAIPFPTSEAVNFGVIEVDSDWRMVGFEEKPTHPKEMPQKPGWSLVSMGNYIFSTDCLIQEICQDAEDSESIHDFGKSILSGIHARRPVYAYDFHQNVVAGQHAREHGYWRDVGTVASYFSSSMDLIAVTPVFDLYNRRWPIHSWYDPNPPAKFVHDDVASSRVGVAVNSIVCDGCIISGGRLERSILGPRVRVNSFSHVSDSILFEGVDVGRYARIRRAIVDKSVRIPAGLTIGYDLEADRRRFHVTDDGIVVLSKGTKLA